MISSCSPCRLDSSWSSRYSAAGPKPLDLAAQFAADRAARPGDQDPPAGDQRGGLLAHHVQLPAAEQARHPELAQVGKRASRSTAARKDGRIPDEQAGGRRRSIDLRRPAGPAATGSRPRGVWPAPRATSGRPRSAEHRQPDGAAQAVGVVEEADRDEPVAGAAPQCADQSPACLARSDDERAQATCYGCAPQARQAQHGPLLCSKSLRGLPRGAGDCAQRLGDGATSASASAGYMRQGQHLLGDLVGDRHRPAFRRAEDPPVRRELVHRDEVHGGADPPARSARRSRRRGRSPHVGVTRTWYRCQACRPWPAGRGRRSPRQAGQRRVVAGGQLRPGGAASRAGRRAGPGRSPPGCR